MLILSQHAKIFAFQFAFGFVGLETISLEHLRTFSETSGRLREIIGNLRKWLSRFRKSRS